MLFFFEGAFLIVLFATGLRAAFGLAAAEAVFFAFSGAVAFSFAMPAFTV